MSGGDSITWVGIGREGTEGWMDGRKIVGGI